MFWGEAKLSSAALHYWLKLATLLNEKLILLSSFAIPAIAIWMELRRALRYMLPQGVYACCLYPLLLHTEIGHWDFLDIYWKWADLDNYHLGRIATGINRNDDKFRL